MLSILIPVYNYDVTVLVNELHKQAVELSIDFEIICLNDSSKSKNPFVSLEHFQWIENETNLGRSRTRNKLMSMAKYPSLLFLDADMRVFIPEFLKRYVDASLETSVVCGGISYGYEKPEFSKRLRWNYGRQKEVKSLKSRQESPYSSFMTGVFLIKKELLERLPFDESLISYGHEDTLLGKELLEQAADIKHIDNRCIHDGLESNEVFISKTKEGLKSLNILYGAGKMNRNYSSVIRLYENLNTLRLLRSVISMTQLLEKLFFRSMISKGRHIWLFQLCKLRWFTELQRSI